jgi:hypothetical protein
MAYARIFGQQRHRYFLRCVAIAAMILFVAATGAAQAPAAGPEVPGLDELKKNSGLLTEFGQLMKKIQDGVQFPAARSQSRLLPLLPESTVFYAALPNYGDASHQALTIFQQEVKDNPDLRGWWQRGEMATEGPKIEDGLEKFYQFSQYLGDEIVVSGAMEGHKKDPSLLILAEVRKPGLKIFLQQMSRELTGKSQTPVRILDLAELPAIKDAQGEQNLVILVRPDFVVAALDLRTLRSFNTRLDSNNREFASTPFGQRLMQAYEGGTTAVGGADLETILKQLPTSTEQNENLFRRSGFADMKYLIWEHKSVDSQAASQMELTFTGPRKGIASWLAAPGPLGSLDFVSPKAVMATAILLKSPAEIFDDVRDIATISNPNAFASIAQMEQGLKLSLRDDLLGHLSGEIALEVDNFAQPDVVWKAILKVNDPERLQTVLNTLLATAPVNPQQSEDGGITYHTLRIPSGQKTVEIGYAFVDGYLVIASSRDTVAEAVRLHRSGESFGRSSKFQAALPPGNLSEVSALLYEDPIAMAALNLQRLSPELAESFSKFGTERTPAVIAAYGEESAIREASRSGGVDVGAGLIVAAIAIPNLLRARIAANESSAVGTLRTANTAEIIYKNTYPQRGYARDLATLGPDPYAPAAVSAEHASLIDAMLGNASCTAGAWCTKSGFQFTINASCRNQRCYGYVVVATPASTSSGTKSFCSTSDAVIRYKVGGPLAAAVTASECRTWEPLQ